MKNRMTLLLWSLIILTAGSVYAQIKEQEVKNVSVTLVEHPAQNGEVQLWLECALPKLPENARVHYATLELRERFPMKVVKKDSVREEAESQGLRFVGEKALRLALRAAGETTTPSWADVEGGAGVQDSLRSLAFPVIAQGELPNETEKYARAQQTKNDRPGVMFDVTRLLQQAKAKGRKTQKLFLAGVGESKRDFQERKVRLNAAAIEGVLKVWYVE